MRQGLKKGLREHGRKDSNCLMAVLSQKVARLILGKDMTGVYTRQQERTFCCSEQDNDARLLCFKELFLPQPGPRKWEQVSFRNQFWNLLQGLVVIPVVAPSESGHCPAPGLCWPLGS